MVKMSVSRNIDWETAWEINKVNVSSYYSYLSVWQSVRVSLCWHSLWLSASHLTNWSFPSNLVNIGHDTDHNPPSSASQITGGRLTRASRVLIVGVIWRRASLDVDLGSMLVSLTVSWCPPQHCSADWLTGSGRAHSCTVSAVQLSLQSPSYPTDVTPTPYSTQKPLSWLPLGSYQIQ